jgi:hypothetical protein
MDEIELANRFKYHQPDQVRRASHERVRLAAGDLADEINIHAPDGREKSLAITKIEEAMMWANAAIARQPATANESATNT